MLQIQLRGEPENTDIVMKKQLLLLAVFTGLVLVNSCSSIQSSVAPVQEIELKEAVKEAKEEWKSLSRKERKAKRSEIKKAIRDYRASGDTDTLLLVIITILLPPLGMFLYEGSVTNRFWISLLLTLLLYIPGLVYTLIVILGEH